MLLFNCIKITVSLNSISFSLEWCYVSMSFYHTWVFYSTLCSWQSFYFDINCNRLTFIAIKCSSFLHNGLCVIPSLLANINNAIILMLPLTHATLLGHIPQRKVAGLVENSHVNIIRQIFSRLVIQISTPKNYTGIIRGEKSFRTLRWGQKDRHTLASIEKTRSKVCWQHIFKDIIPLSRKHSASAREVSLEIYKVGPVIFQSRKTFTISL